MTISDGSSKKATTACPICGKAFEYYRSWPRKYCSNVCKGKALVGNTGRPTGTRYAATCEQCGTTYETTPTATRGRFCSTACWGQWSSEHVRGDSHPNAGRKFNRPGTLVNVTCGICGTVFQETPAHAVKRRFCSKACQGAWQSVSRAGPNSPTWLGGYEPYYGPTWRPAMRAVRARDKVCQRCGKTPKEAGKALDVHHLVPFRRFGLARHAEANRTENLIALCNPCHLLTEWESNRRQATAQKRQDARSE